MLTVVIPVAPYHTSEVQNALASVYAQTMPCEVVTVYDVQGHGAGWARNQGLAQVETQFVVFLDADDSLAPTFVEDTLAVYQQGHYVYTDYWRDAQAVESPKCAWVKGRWHVVTTLLATDDVRRVGGFDEILPGAEDTDFYWKLTRSGVCGLRLAKPLFHYGANGKRGHEFVLGNQYWPTMKTIHERYKDFPMACCGDEMEMQIPPVGDHVEGDVLAQALWHGNRAEFGRVTGRRYPRLSFPRTAWVDPRDVQTAQHLWRVVNTNGAPAPTPIARPVVNITKPSRTNVPPRNALSMGQQLYGAATLTLAPELQSVEHITVAPDFSVIIDKARRALG